MSNVTKTVVFSQTLSGVAIELCKVEYKQDDMGVDYNLNIDGQSVGVIISGVHKALETGVISEVLKSVYASNSESVFNSYKQGKSRLAEKYSARNKTIARTAGKTEVRQNCVLINF